MGTLFVTGGAGFIGANLVYRILATEPDRVVIIDKLKALGEEATGQFDQLSGLFRRAQRKVERRHFRQRRALMYFEKERKKMQRQMGQDPYLDTPGS